MSANMKHPFDLSEDLVVYSRSYDPEDSLVVRRKWLIYGFEEEISKKRAECNNIFKHANRGVFGISNRENLKQFYSMLWHAIYAIFQETKYSPHCSWNSITIQKMPSSMLEAIEISKAGAVEERKWEQFLIISSGQQQQQNGSSSSFRNEMPQNFIKLVKLNDENQRGDPINYSLDISYQEAIHLAFYMADRFSFPSLILDKKYNFTNDYFF